MNKAVQMVTVYQMVFAAYTSLEKSKMILLGEDLSHIKKGISDAMELLGGIMEDIENVEVGDPDGS